MRAAVLVATTVAALTVAGAGPVLAAPTAARTHAQLATSSSARAAVPAGFEHVELALAPRDQAGLAQLARVARTLTPAVREAQRQAALPGAARAATVATAAEALGLTLISTSDTNVVVAGSPSLVRSLFGSARDNRPNLPTAQELPLLPTSLRGLVLVAGGGDETRPAFLARNNADGSLSQAEFQSVFGVPLATTPPTASSPTVATLQFSDWHSSDLTNYVQTQHIYGNTSYDPIADGGFTAVNVDGGNAGDYYGTGEVALDQEAIATMAPGLRQRAYFTASMSSMAQADAINAVAQDASAQHILTLSTSYGNCEADQYSGPNDPQLQNDLNAVSNVLAAGVTFFGPTGDDGSTDCPKDHPNQNTVDVPAAFPNVVAVGGTSVQTSGGTTTQTAWSGSGGGYSTLFPRPSYQNGVVTNAQRGAPDIAMDGDPATGLDGYDSSPVSAGGCNGSCVGTPEGGTSLATPLAASALASILAARGNTSGIGDIHTTLYGAPSTAYTDITSGSNGAFSAGPGWDAVTGLGAPLWSTLLRAAAGTTPYVPINPERVVDTRTGTGRVYTGALQPGTTYTFSLANTPLPLGQQAYAFNVTAIGPTGPGNLQLTSACGTAPAMKSSLVNYQPGKTVANFVVAPNPSACDGFHIVSAGSAANVAIDAVGYYTAGFTGTGPTRIVDTRSGLGGTTGPVAPGTHAVFTVAGTAGVPTDAKAVAINVTAVNPSGGGNLRVYPDTDGAPPTTSNINFIPGVDKAVFAVVPLPANGKIDVYAAGSPADVAIDVSGYYPASSTLATVTPPVRVLDTRPASGPTQSLPSPLAPGTPYPVTVTGGTTGVPADAAAVLVSLTSIHAATSTGSGNLRIYPAGQSVPTVSTVNYVSPSSDVANFAIVKVGAGGEIDLYTAGSPVDAALDILGYVPASS